MPLFRKSKVYAKIPKEIPQNVRLGPAIGLTFKKVTCQVKVNKEKREILRGVSGYVKPAQTLALMGPSGAGKTTLLNVLSLRYRAGCVAGDVRWNGTPTLTGFAEGQIHRFQAFVPQAVCLMHTLTVEENVRFSANLRLPKAFSDDTREGYIHRTIHQLRLSHVKDSIIGHEGSKVLSGGEKKRASIAVELVSAPSLLFLDEPTTGLSATDSLQVACLLSNMAKSGITIICSLHQPRTDIFRLFDNLMILSLGETAYFGPTQQVEHHFSRMGFETPPSESLPDFLLDLITEDEVSEHAQISAKFKGSSLRKEAEDYIELVHSHNAGDLDWDSTMTSSGMLNWDVQPEDSDEVVPQDYESRLLERPGTLVQLKWLIWRNFLNMRRDRTILTKAVILRLLYGLIIGTLWSNVDDDDDATEDANIQGALFLVCQAIGLAAFTYLSTDSKDRELFRNEHAGGAFSVGNFLLARYCVEIPNFMLQSLILLLVIYPLVGLKNYFTNWVCFWLVLLVLFTELRSYSAMVAAFSKEESKVPMMITAATFLLSANFSGYYISYDDLPDFYKPFYYLSFLKWPYAALNLNQFDDGSAALETANLPSFSTETEFIDVLVMVSVGLFCALVEARVTRHMHRLPTYVTHSALDQDCKPMKRTKEADAGVGPGLQSADGDGSREREERRGACPLCIQMKFMSISCVAKSRNGQTRKILDDVSGIVNPGCSMLAIMGPSGAGKTSLVDILAGQSTPDLEVIFNNQTREQLGDAFHRVVGYVSQEDFLWPTLTVEEMLLFTVKMTNPRAAEEAAAQRIVDDIMQDLGLSPVAKSVIGGGGIQGGISGGERKRLSIGMALTTQPALLILDEPTSGLSAADAQKTMTAIRSLALHGWSIVLTIHQPRLSIYQMFDSVMLLAAQPTTGVPLGGRTIYFGPPGGVAVEYFGGLGFRCPHGYNFAEYLLDIVTENTLDDIHSTFAQTECQMSTAEQIRTLVSSFPKSRPWKTMIALIKRNNGKHTPLDSNGAEVPTIAEQVMHDPAKRALLVEHSLSTWSEQQMLVKRQALMTKREPKLLIGAFIQRVFMAIILGSLFSAIPDKDETETQQTHANEFACLFMIGLTLFQSLVPATDVFRQQYNLAGREIRLGFYRSSSFVRAIFVLDVPNCVLGCTIFWLIVGPWVGYDSSAGVYLAVILATVVFLLTALAVSHCFCIYAKDDKLLAQENFGFFQFFSICLACFYITYDDLPVYWQPFTWLNIYRYNFFATMSAEYDDEDLAYFGFPIYSGEGVWPDILCLLVFLVFYRLLEHWMLANNVVTGEYDFFATCKQLVQRRSRSGDGRSTSSQELAHAGQPTNHI